MLCPESRFMNNPDYTLTQKSQIYFKFSYSSSRFGFGMSWRRTFNPVLTIFQIQAITSRKRKRMGWIINPMIKVPGRKPQTAEVPLGITGRAEPELLSTLYCPEPIPVGLLDSIRNNHGNGENQSIGPSRVDVAHSNNGCVVK